MINRLYSRLCGPRRAAAETAYLENPESAFALQKLERSLGGPPGFVAILRRDYEKLEASTDTGKQWYADAAARYKVSLDRGLWDFALQLASRPHQLLWLPILDQLHQAIGESAVLLRAARMMALLSVAKNRDRSGGSLPGWKW